MPKLNEASLSVNRPRLFGSSVFSIRAAIAFLFLPLLCAYSNAGQNPFNVATPQPGAVITSHTFTLKWTSDPIAVGTAVSIDFLDAITLMNPYHAADYFYNSTNNELTVTVPSMPEGNYRLILTSYWLKGHATAPYETQTEIPVEVRNTLPVLSFVSPQPNAVITGDKVHVIWKSDPSIAGSNVTFKFQLLSSYGSPQEFHYYANAECNEIDLPLPPYPPGEYNLWIISDWMESLGSAIHSRENCRLTLADAKPFLSATAEIDSATHELVVDIEGRPEYSGTVLKISVGGNQVGYIWDFTTPHRTFRCPLPPVTGDFPVVVESVYRKAIYSVFYDYQASSNVLHFEAPPIARILHVSPYDSGPLNVYWEARPEFFGSAARFELWRHFPASPRIPASDSKIATLGYQWDVAAQNQFGFIPPLVNQDYCFIRMTSLWLEQNYNALGMVPSYDTGYFSAHLSSYINVAPLPMFTAGGIEPDWSGLYHGSFTTNPEIAGTAYRLDLVANGTVVKTLGNLWNAGVANTFTFSDPLVGYHNQDYTIRVTSYWLEQNHIAGVPAYGSSLPIKLAPTPIAAIEAASTETNQGTTLLHVQWRANLAYYGSRNYRFVLFPSGALNYAAYPLWNPATEIPVGTTSVIQEQNQSTFILPANLPPARYGIAIYSTDLIGQDPAHTSVNLQLQIQ